jgi:signal transduction histidine kinase
MSVRNRLLLLFFVITTAAVVFVYLYVVPQLDSSLTAEKLRNLEQTGDDGARRIDRVMRSSPSQEELRRVIASVAERSEADRVTVLGVGSGPSGPAPEFVVGDSELEREAIVPSYPGAAGAAASGQVTSSVERVNGRRIGETSIPGFVKGHPRWVTVLSVDLSDVEESVAVVRRQILIAGAIAIALALAAGWFAARAHSRRLRRLEAAAVSVAEGNFRTQIPVDSSDEVGQLALSFNEMQRRLARLDSARKEFIANASHELRTPIFSLGGFIELLSESDLEEAVRQDFLGEMRGQVERMTRLATDLLDLSRLDAGQLEVERVPVDLGACARVVGEEFRALAEAGGHELLVEDGPAEALADEQRVQQIARILVENALRHTPGGTRIDIGSGETDGRAFLTVRDTGPGVPAEDREHVFERFYRAGGGKASGSGLGLAIASELAQRMEGTIEVRSDPGETVFTLLLPGVDEKTRENGRTERADALPALPSG